MEKGGHPKRVLLRVNALEIKWAIGPPFSILYKSNMRLYRVDGCAKPAAVRIDEYRLTLSGAIFFAHQIHTFRASCVQKDKIAVKRILLERSNTGDHHSWFCARDRRGSLCPLRCNGGDLC